MKTNTKQLLFAGAVVAAAAKFHSQLGWKPALILGAVAVADNVIPTEESA